MHSTNFATEVLVNMNEKFNPCIGDSTFGIGLTSFISFVKMCERDLVVDTYTT